MVDVKNEQKTIKKELQDLKKTLHAVLPTAKGEEERENTETRVESVEAVFKRVEKCLSDLLTEKSFKEGPEQDTTCVGKTCDQISGVLRDLQENLKMINENLKTEMAEQSQKDTEQTYGEKRKCEEATTAFLYEGRFKLNETMQVSSYEHPSKGINWTVS